MENGKNEKPEAAVKSAEYSAVKEYKNILDEKTKEQLKLIESCTVLVLVLAVAIAMVSFQFNKLLSVGFISILIMAACIGIFYILEEMNHTNDEYLIPTVETARFWLKKHWNNKEVVFIADKVDFQVLQVLTESKLEIAKSFTNQEEKAKFMAFCCKCGILEQ